MLHTCGKAVVGPYLVHGKRTVCDRGALLPVQRLVSRPRWHYWSGGEQCTAASDDARGFDLDIVRGYHPSHMQGADELWELDQHSMADLSYPLGRRTVGTIVGAERTAVGIIMWGSCVHIFGW